MISNQWRISCSLIIHFSTITYIKKIPLVVPLIPPKGGRLGKHRTPFNNNVQKIACNLSPAGGGEEVDISPFGGLSDAFLRNAIDYVTFFSTERYIP